MNGLKSHRILGRRKPHGTRLRYMGGCKCWRCMKANRDYEKQRHKARAAGDWNGIIPAAKARAHLLQLRTWGIGRRTVGKLTGLPPSIIAGIASGKRKNLRARSERLILKVTEDNLPLATRIPIKATLKLLRQLDRLGYDEARIAKRLGYRRASLQLQASWISLRRAMVIRKLAEKLK